ncbi:MAG TPA: hypothetical protein VFJ84_00720 [Candidatus Saccharimonadales bacterium]|nr:hypothetical protein [Candidatus Saccharimonadales bacterium]
MPQEENTVPPPAEPAAPPTPQPDQKPKDPTRLDRIRGWYTVHKKLSIPLTVLVLVLVLAAIPFTRYAAAGAVIKKDFSVKVLDDATGTPVSGVTVTAGNTTADTDSAGIAVLKHIKVGGKKLLITKKYYKDGTLKITVPIMGQKDTPAIRLTATGRQVKVSVVNGINRNPLKDVDISVAGTTAKTDANGQALIVLPAGTPEQKAKLSLEGFNDAQVSIKVSSEGIQANPFSLTPSGKVYFLSKLSGQIDVVKTNLDGTSRQTVLAGTGKEDDRNTVLLASRDWKYLALLSRRAGSTPSLYLMSTADDSLSVIDEGSYDFTLAGWVGDNFVYTASQTNYQPWKSGQDALKSYNAPSKKLKVLDQTAATGTSTQDYVGQHIGDVYAYNGQVYYIMNWSSSFDDANMALLAAKQATFNSINPDGTGKKAIRSFGLSAGEQSADISVDEQIEGPGSVELHFTNGDRDEFYSFANGQVKSDPSMDVQSYYEKTYPAYLLSPSGSNTFWAEERDGKNTLFVGDEDGQNPKQIATLSDYSSYGWYTDKYLLVSKDGSELYIMAKDGSQPPVKISDYHKPSFNFQGYGGGYGGL